MLAQQSTDIAKLQSTLKHATRLAGNISDKNVNLGQSVAQLGDVFELQDKVGRRVAEALRVGLTTESHRGSAPGEAVEALPKTSLRTTGRSLTWPGLGHSSSAARAEGRRSAMCIVS